MRLSMRAEHDLPLYLATLSPKMLRLTGEIADGWLSTSFVPEGAKEAYFDHLDAGPGTRHPPPAPGAVLSPPDASACTSSTRERMPSAANTLRR
jgi:alkanesulfonate monooxygenase SsuD/methylene tetrahydromethanopterin reductase-like flavin-dependent oxidoreductase (luciferase family)